MRRILDLIPIPCAWRPLFARHMGRLRSVDQLLKDHVSLTVECIDRRYMAPCAICRPRRSTCAPKVGPLVTIRLERGS